jgi:hypothetical protein
MVDSDAPVESTTEPIPSPTPGVRFDLKYELEKTFNLDDIDDEDDATVEPEFTLSLSYTPLEDFEAFINTEVKREYGFDISPESENDPLSLQVTQVFLHFDELLEIGQGNVRLRIGRRRFDDEREWLYDERLDGPRVYYEWFDLTIELSATRQTVFDRDFLNADNQDKINNYFQCSLYELDNVEVGNFEIDELGAGGYVFKRDDLTEDNEDHCSSASSRTARSPTISCAG